MRKETISKILEKILNKSLSFTLDYFPYEESKGHYKNIYKIIAPNKTYVLKKAKGNELDIYSYVNNNDSHIPHYYGSYHYYNNDYILFDFAEGHNLMKMDRKHLTRVIDAIIDIQNKYWSSPKEFGLTKEAGIKQRYNRLNYLPEELKETYEQYIAYFKCTPSTFSHEDLLPFNT